MVKYQNLKNNLFPVVDYSELFKNSDSYNLLVDYLTLAFSNDSIFIEHYLKLLVSENSDYAIYDFKGYQFSVSRFNGRFGAGLKFYVSYNSIPVEFCTIQKIEKWFHTSVSDGHNKTLYTCEFKGQYFRLESIGYFDKNLWKDFVYLAFNKENGRITRLDRTIDFFQKNKSSKKWLYIVSPLQFFTKSGIRSNVSIDSRQKWKSFKVSNNGWENLEKIDYGNWYYGSRKGKRVYFRMYDKLKDLNQSTGKWKELLYFDYLKCQKVVRVEFECLYRFCYWYTIKTFNELLEKCDSVFHISNVDWKWKTCYEFKHSENVIDLKHNENRKVRYIENFGQHWYTIFENSFNCYSILNEQILKRSESQFIPYTKNKIKEFLNDAINSIDKI